MIDHGFDVAFDGHVRAYEARSIAKLPREPLSPLSAPASNHHFGAIGYENLGGARTDSTCAPRNHRDLTFQCSHQVTLLPATIFFASDSDARPQSVLNGGRTLSMTSEVMERNDIEVDCSDAKTPSQSRGEHSTGGFVGREKGFNSQFL
jgi:hypothetical protein